MILGSSPPDNSEHSSEQSENTAAPVKELPGIQQTPPKPLSPDSSLKQEPPKQLTGKDRFFTRDYVVYTAKEEGIYPIQESEWNRLKKMIEGVIEHRRIYQILASIGFGFSGSGIFSAIAFHFVQGLPAWVLPTIWAIVGAFTFNSIVLLILDRQQKDFITFTTKIVLEEMKLIEERFQRPQE